MKSQGDITGRTGDWEDLQPRGEGGANWQVSEARTAGLEDVPPCPPWPILWDITQKYDSNWGYNGLLSPAHSTELYSQNIEGEGIWGRKLWLEICYSRCERRVDSRLTVYSSSMLECEMWDVRCEMWDVRCEIYHHRFDSYWTAGLDTTLFISGPSSCSISTIIISPQKREITSSGPRYQSQMK